ncbi:trimethoprim-resistant dihydrofolate reductase DfrA [Spirochaeta cellobiosiphila]|uniref:trimethoprim-resistant dihydrofolate reductase DfrA n=1 Tax=Spirochaeta cellobiosiphila TaxID=504483 RepID=UPI00040E5B0C|nr:trimethoprim-resistant dihydrofolate reductase DfrA [Spirochaeta cellobiosiphila]
MKISLMAAVSENGIIGSDLDIPWKVKGEQLLFKAITYNQWIVVGRKTFESMGKLPNRHYAVISRTVTSSEEADVIFFPSIEEAITELETKTDHVIVSGGGQIYQAFLPYADTIHRSIVHTRVEGNVGFPDIPDCFHRVFEQKFHSNIDYTYQIWIK